MIQITLIRYLQHSPEYNSKRNASLGNGIWFPRPEQHRPSLIPVITCNFLGLACKSRYVIPNGSLIGPD